MQINLSKLKTGDKVAFSERVEKIVSHICRDNGETRSVSFDDGTILNWDNSLWELTGLPERKLIWRRSGFWDLGYTSEKERETLQARFVLNMEPSGNWRLEEILRFEDRQGAIAHAEQRARQTEVS